MDLKEYAVLAEQLAKEKKLEDEHLKTMKAEAKKLQDELAEALFTPYVGKLVRGEYGRHYIAKLNTTHLSTSDTKQLTFFSEEHGTPRYSVKGFVASVEWDSSMRARLKAINDDYRKEVSWVGGEGDIATQAVTLAKILATEMIKILVI